MIENISKNLISLKQEFRRVYCGTSHVQEIMPLDESDDFPIPQNDLDSLHIFLQNNSIYYDKFETKINDVNCMVYEGDINKYWLNSIGHESSTQPFSPTWMLTAYIITSMAKMLNYKEFKNFILSDHFPWFKQPATVVDTNTEGIDTKDYTKI